MTDPHDQSADKPDDTPLDPHAEHDEPAPDGSPASSHDAGVVAGEEDEPAPPERDDQPEEGASAARREAMPAPGGGRRLRESFEAGAQLRALREELGTVREELAAQARSRTTDRAHVRQAIGWLSELLPRVEDLETGIREVLDRLPPPGPQEGTDEDGDAGGQGTPVPTPSIGWDDMDHDTARAAWEALSRFVGEVLHRRYRLTRLQVPDCWPLHPRLVRELAWLRSSYVDAGAVEPELPTAAAPWHTRALPVFLTNMLDAVDVRECRPGVHRLTEPEVEDYLARATEAEHQGRPAPNLSEETGPDRPRLRPETFPTRGTAPTRRSTGPVAPPVRALPDLVVGSCDPGLWLDYYREASAADLATRPPARTPAGGAPGAPSARDGQGHRDADGLGAEHRDGPGGLGEPDGLAEPGGQGEPGGLGGDDEPRP